MGLSAQLRCSSGRSCLMQFRPADLLTDLITRGCSASEGVTGLGAKAPMGVGKVGRGKAQAAQLCPDPALPGWRLRTRDEAPELKGLHGATVWSPCPQVSSAPVHLVPPSLGLEDHPTLPQPQVKSHSPLKSWLSGLTHQRPPLLPTLGMRSFLPECPVPSFITSLFISS